MFRVFVQASMLIMGVAHAASSAPECVKELSFATDQGDGKIWIRPDYNFEDKTFEKMEVDYRPPLVGSTIKYSGQEITGSSGYFRISPIETGDFVYSLPSPFTETNGLEYEGATGDMASVLKTMFDPNSIELKLRDGTVLSSEALSEVTVDIPRQFLQNFRDSRDVVISGKSASGDFEYFEIVFLGGLTDALSMAKAEFDKHSALISQASGCDWNGTPYTLSK